MKLHLPKGLFVAVMAAMTLVPAAWGATTWDGDGSIYYLDQTSVETVDATEKRDTVKFNADTSQNAPASLVATIGTTKLKNNQHLYIDKHAWDDDSGTRNFVLLTIDNLEIAVRLQIRVL